MWEKYDKKLPSEQVLEWVFLLTYYRICNSDHHFDLQLTYIDESAQVKTLKQSK